MLEILVIGGLMGLLGQGARAVVGLKGMVDDAKVQGLGPDSVFRAARLLTSLLIGFLVGLAAALIYLADGGASPLTPKILFGFVAAGYVGTDFLEAFISNYLKPAPTPRPVPVPAVQGGPLSSAANLLARLKDAAAPPEIVVAPETKQFVLSVFQQLAPGVPIAEDTKLADLGYTDVAIDIIRGAIDARQWHGVRLGFGALNRCATVLDVMKKVQSAKH